MDQFEIFMESLFDRFLYAIAKVDRLVFASDIALDIVLQKLTKAAQFAADGSRGAHCKNGSKFSCAN